MCNVCNGRHSVYEYMEFGTMVKPCPICGPRPKAEVEAEMDKIHQRLVKAKARFAMEGVIPC